MWLRFIGLIIVVTIVVSCAGHGMTQYVVVNPVTKDTIAKNKTYERYSHFYDFEDVHVIPIDSVSDLCHMDKRNVAHVYINGKEEKSRCELLGSVISDHYDLIDSIKISNGERYSQYEVFSIFVIGFVAPLTVGAGELTSKIKYELDDDPQKSYTPIPFWAYAAVGIISVVMSVYTYFDLNGSILYMAKPHQEVKYHSESENAIADRAPL